MKSSLYTIILFLCLACASHDPQKIIDKAIEAAGGEKYLHSAIEFDFRNRHYIARREGGQYSYERIFIEPKDSTQHVHDFLNNEGFRREINGAEAAIPDSMKVKYTSSVNSVLYFALLPYGLNDSSVKKKWIGETQLDGKDFYKIQINFDQQGGGEDFEDTFIYWINQKDFTIGFIAYSYEENGEIGLRLRKAFNSRKVNGILFQDYINYKPKGELKLEELEEAFRKGELEELSKIESTNLEVK